MSVIPTGVPLWLRTNDFASYGGNLNKKNFASRGVINPKTDVGAEAFARMTADLAALGRTAPFAVLQIQCDDTTPAAPTVTWVTMMTGTRNASYLGSLAPAGFPTVARNGNGDFTLSFAAYYTDPYGVIGAFVAKNPKAQLNGPSAGMATAEVVTSTTVRVRAFVAAGTAKSNALVTVTVGSGS